MNITFNGGYYVFGQLFEINADINVSPEYYSALKKELKIKKVKDFYLTRVGNGNRDGAYVMLDDFNQDGIAYSFGICNDVSWDDAMTLLGYDVYMYDHTIDALPYNKENFHFFREGIAGVDEETLPLKSLMTYLNRNGHLNSQNMILKMDVEGAEWDFLETVSVDVLNQFDQITFEFHNLIKPDSEKFIPLFQKLNQTHQLIHLHGNNCGYSLQIGNSVFCDVLEATYVNKNKYDFEDYDDLCLPMYLDFPNDLGRPDIVLGNWNEPFSIS